MKVALCAIVKLENNYIREWIDHYKSLGFDNIILYDNNQINGEKLEKVLKKYIKNKYVIIENARGKSNAQMSSYRECYQKYGKEFDWIAFFDADEFLQLENYDTIKSFLSDSKFSKFNWIKINWQIFDDNGLLDVRKHNYSIKRFTHPISICQEQTKSILRTKVPLLINSSHGALNIDPLNSDISDLNIKNVKSCDANGVYSDNVRDITTYISSNGGVRLYHYMFKTIGEFINVKMNRGYPTLWANQGKDFLNIDTFFVFNKKTPLKEHYAQCLLKLKNNKTPFLEKISIYAKIKILPPDKKIGRIMRKFIHLFKK